MNIVRLTLVTVFIVTVFCKTVPVRLDDDSVQGWNHHNLIRRMTTAANETEETDQIVGGTKVGSKDEYPYMVSLILNERSFICGGTLISSQHVLTAAHCIPRSFNSFTLLMYTTVLGQATYSQKITNRAQIRVHESYSSRTMLNDIALIKLNTPVGIVPAMLPQANLNIANTWARAIGWGLTTEKGQISTDLLYTALMVNSDSSCQKSYQGINPRLQICADKGNQNGQHDTCQGDSGGPLLKYNGPGKGMLLGITSFGEGCGRKAGVYTRVSGYLDWIKRAM